MGIIKETAEDAAVTIDKARAISEWAYTSFARVLFVMLLIESIILGTTYAYIDNLLTETRKTREIHTQQVTALGKELGYKVALDAITMCLVSAKDKPKLHAWYCKHAVIQYKQVSTNWPQERVNEVIDKLAYGAMKNDISHYLRSVELDRLMQSPATREEELLKLFLNKVSVVLWIVAVATIMIGVYLALWILPNRKKIRLMHNPAVKPDCGLFYKN